MRLLALAWGMAILLPYPALPVGGNTGLQAAHVLIFVLLPGACLHWKAIGHAWLLFAALSLALMASSMVNGLGTGDINASVLLIFALLSVPITAWIFGTQQRAFLGGIWIALAIHGFVGIIQAWSFSLEYFPFPALFVNPSFAEFNESWQSVYASYVKRPFGLSPEPSALLAMAGPWVLMMAASLSDDSRDDHGQRLFQWRAPHMLTLLLILIVCVLSGSGGLAFLGSGLVAITTLFAIRRAADRPGFTLFVMVGLVVFVVILLFYLGNRISSEAGELGSWDERLISLQIGLRLIADGDAAQLWFGYGAGQVSLLADRLQSTGAVHSWVLTYVVGAGLVGFVALLAAAALIVRSIGHTADPMTWTILMSVWLAGPLLMSGYSQLLAIWAFAALPMVIAQRQIPPGRALGSPAFERFDYGARSPDLAG